MDVLTTNCIRGKFDVNSKLAFFALSTSCDQLVNFWQVGLLWTFMFSKHSAKFYLDIIIIGFFLEVVCYHIPLKFVPQLQYFVSMDRFIKSSSSFISSNWTYSRPYSWYCITYLKGMLLKQFLWSPSRSPLLPSYAKNVAIAMLNIKDSDPNEESCYSSKINSQHIGI